MNIERIITGLASRIRMWIHRRRGTSILGHCRLDGGEIPYNPERVVIHAGVWLAKGVTLLCPEKGDGSTCLEIGKSTCINRWTILDAIQNLKIGEKCMIGPFCYITDHDHTKGGDGTFASGTLKVVPTVLESGCWVGANATILKGVRIGRGSVVGAGSVVTRDVPDGAVVAGNPARIIRQ